MRTEYMANNIRWLTTDSGVAKPNSLSSRKQAVTGSILDKAPFYSIVDFRRFAVRLSMVGSQVHQAGGTMQYGDH